MLPAMGGVFGVIREETPKYEEVEKTESFEIRQYGPLLVAETAFQGKRGEVRRTGHACSTLTPT